jgi:uncharacterized 2Fe-2S/4Fe-4S cluster protein (DUF4445 family)
MSIKITFQPSGRSIEITEGETVLDAAIKAGEAINSECGGEGTCGKCLVKADGIPWLACELTPAADMTVHVIDAIQPMPVILTEGTGRAAELDPAVRNYDIELEPPGDSFPLADRERLLAGLAERYGLEGLSVSYPLLKRLPHILRDSGWKVTAQVRKGREVIGLVPGPPQPLYGVAFDIGTTTIAGYLVNLESGETVSVASVLNPQKSFGEDVIARISHAQNDPEGAARLKAAVIDALNEMLGKLAMEAAAVREDIMEAVVVGNTTMHHLALGLPVAGLGVYPFTPALVRPLELKATDIGLLINECGYVVTLPLAGGFVGADTVAALLAVDPESEGGSSLIIDIGTNGEIVVSDKGRLLCASCATGPAFEGAKIMHGMRAGIGAIERVMIDPETLEASYKVIGSPGWSSPSGFTGALGLCGSGVVDAVAGMYLAGIIDIRGAFVPDSPSPRIRLDKSGQPEYVIAWGQETATGHDITITQEDVRAVQLAKAALSAGVKVLLSEAGLERTDRVYLAGAFGNFIDPKSAAVIGLLPGWAAECAVSAGNAAGEGARAALLSVGKREKAKEMSARLRHIELSVHPEFQGLFLGEINFP